MRAPAAVFPDCISLRCGEHKLFCLNDDVTDHGCWPTQRRVYFWDTVACVDNVAKQKGGGERWILEWIQVFLFFFCPLSLLLSNLIPLVLDECILKYQNVTLDCVPYSLVENKSFGEGWEAEWVFFVFFGGGGGSVEQAAALLAQICC